MKSKSSKSACSTECNTRYAACASSKEHESVCRMKRAQCHCGCSS
jgi:hypothetical protein